MIHKYFHRAAVLLVVVAGTSSAVISQSTDSLLSKAWLSWRENNHTVIKSNFLDVLKQDPSNARAQIGLSFLYDLVGKHNEAFRCYQKALDQLKDPYPYVYAAWAQGKFTGSGEETVE